MLKRLARWWRNDVLKKRRWVRGFLAWLGGVAIQVSIVGPDVMMTWSARRWALGIVVAALPGIVGLINLGDPNQKPGAGVLVDTRDGRVVEVPTSAPAVRS